MRLNKLLQKIDFQEQVCIVVDDEIKYVGYPARFSPKNNVKVEAIYAGEHGMIHIDARKKVKK